jgi:ATP-dependent RNA helicase RhlE
MHIRVGTVFGGVGHGPQRSMLLHGLAVLVATPGRLIDHLGEGAVDLAGTEILVLDEADRMLDMGFILPIRRIVAKLSMKRQSLFFSATMPDEIGELAHDMLRQPVKVSVAPAATTVERVAQRIIHVERERKRDLLVELLSDPRMSRTLVFTRTKRGADRVAQHLDGAGIDSAAIHGNKSQSQREQALAAFKRSTIRVLVATDIAARGIDVDLVTHVVNFELPDTPESYVHRIGRTARAGAEGCAISLVDGSERGQLRDIEWVTRQRIPAEDRRNGNVANHARPKARERRDARKIETGARSARADRRYRSAEPRHRVQETGERARPERGRIDASGISFLRRASRGPRGDARRD